MALLSARLRRAIALSSSLISHSPYFTAKTAAPFPLLRPAISSLRPGNPTVRPPRYTIQSLSFRSSAPSWMRRADSGDNKIDPNEILFEGCDYNHWLITMDFPKDPKPTPEEMVETYVQTLAKVVGSVEEAKKRMYACSTTTYQGFQAVMTEEMSEKFRGLPGVVFILPDSYIDPVNKEYGGDKYDNGVITPRPPPIQYGRQGRYNDRNRNYDRPRYDRQRDSRPMQQGSQPYDRQSPMQGDGRNYAPQQGSQPYDRQGPMQGDGRNYVPQQGSQPYDRQGPMQGDGRNYAPQQNFNRAGQDRQDYGPPGARDFDPSTDRRDPGQVYGQPGGGNYVPGGRDGYQGERRPYQSNFNQAGPGNFVPQERRDLSQGYQGDSRETSSSGGAYRQGMSAGYGGDPRQAVSGYGPSHTGPGEGQNFPQVEYRDGAQGDQRNFPQPGQRMADEGRN